MSSKRACLGCRARKVKCVPGPRRCERCTNMGIEECVFDPIKKRGIGRTLRMGEACNFCRIRKKKCDAKRPCTTCTVAKTAAECVYDDQRVPYQTGFDSWYDTEDYSAGTRLGDAGSVELWVRASASATDEQNTSEPLPAHCCSSGIIDGIPHIGSVDEIPPIFVLPFLHPSISPDLRINLSFLGEENLQVQASETDATDTDMRSRLWLMVRLLKFGVQFSSKKMEAFLQGDLSGTVLNRSFVCGSHVLGMMPSAGMDYSPATVHFHARRVQTAWESLADLFKSGNYKVCLHAAVLVVSSHVYLRMPQMALLYIQKSCDFIKRGDLRFVPTCGRPPKFSEELHETLAALSQTIYWANYLFLTYGGPEPRATAKLEEEFCQDLPQSYPILFRICPLTMRTQGILLVRDANLLQDKLAVDHVNFGSLRTSYYQMLESLDEFSQKLLDDITTFRHHRDKNGADVVSGICIACLTQVATLCEVIGRNDPSAKAGMDSLCDSTLQKLGALTSELCFDEYTCLDLLLGDSWRKSLIIFDARLKSLPLEPNRSLQHCRNVVAETYAGFCAGLPDFQPPILYSLATMEDGRTKESKYPSLMSLESRVEFGI